MVLGKSYPRGRGPCHGAIWESQLAAHLPVGETEPLFLVRKKSLVFLLERLGFNIRFRLWHHFKTSSESNPSSLDKASCLIHNSWGQRWCHVILKGSSYWSTTRKKSHLPWVQPLWRCPGKEAAPQSSQAVLPTNRLLWLQVSCTFLGHGSTHVLKDLWVLFPHQTTKIPRLFHLYNLKDREIKASRPCVGLK